MGSKILEFVPISSSIDPSFWNKFSEIKLNVDKLDEVVHPIWGYFSNINNKSKVPILEVNSTSFNTHFESQKIYIPFHGKIHNTNTIETFKNFDKTKIINDIGLEVFESIENGEALNKPSLLNKFFIISFMDLKKFYFYYWFAFPVPHNLTISHNDTKSITEIFSETQLESLWEKYCELETHQKPYFLVNFNEETPIISSLQSKLSEVTLDSNCYFGFYDLSLLDDFPGSTLRNYVTLILHHCPFLHGKSANFLSLRLKRGENGKLTLNNSLIFNLSLPICQPSLSDLIKNKDSGWVGWEKNERGKLGPRLSNLKSFLDPKELAESSVDLNLKLMKWRILSNIDLEKIKSTNFLLLGSGTLGCSVARILLGWGARNITFVDNSVVSYSNPVRQSLFTFEDSKIAKPKSQAASDNLRNIFPGVKSKSYQLTIPMPGHTIGDSMLEQVKQDVELLRKLIEENDIIFLLMDSRESRWLPTVLGTYYNKTVINAALGFDSYLVMRHGVKVDLEEFDVRQHPPGFKSLKGNFLGCYFCNDVTAPGNSMKDRSLDQQCTVTRPGISAIAGALSAELAISILQHKEGAKAPAFYKIGKVEHSEKELDYQCALGLLPHCIRGYLATFSQVLPATERYKLCIACSDTVQQAYHDNGFDFLFEVFQNSKYLEDITGLSALTKQAEDIGIWEFSDEDEIQCMSYSDENVASSSNISFEGNKSRGETFEDSCTFVEKTQDVDDQNTSGFLDVEPIPKDPCMVEIFKKLLSKLSKSQNLNSASSSNISNILLEANEQKSTEEMENELKLEPAEEIFILKNREFMNSSNSIMYYPSASTLSGKNLPKELLPILEKQKSMGSVRYNISSRYIFKEEKKAEIENLKTTDSGNGILTVKSKISSFVSTDSMPSYFEKLGRESTAGSMKTVTHFVTSRDFQSTDSEYKNSFINFGKQQKKEQFSTLLSRNLASSSSLYTDEYDRNYENIITLAKPKEMYSSGSLTSENLATDASVYYMAKSGSSGRLVQ